MSELGLVNQIDGDVFDDLRNEGVTAVRRISIRRNNKA